MKTKYIYIVILLVFNIFLLSSCKKFLDIQPRGRVIPNKMDDFEKMLFNTNLLRFLSLDVEFVTDDFYNTAINKDELNNLSKDTRLYLWQNEIYIEKGEQEYSPWARIYESVYQYNAIINEAPKVKDATPARLNPLMGKARFGRALCFWYLLNLYAKPYRQSTAGQDMGIPLVQSNSIEEELPDRGTVQGCYNFIISELNTAAELVPEVADNTHLITKGAVYGMLARSYLMVEDFENAAKAADKALSYNSNLVDYNEMYQDKVNRYNNVKYTGLNEYGTNALTNELTFSENILSLQFGYSSGMFNKVIAPQTVKLIDSTSDLRRLFLKPGNLQDWDRLFRYSEILYTVNPGITTPEMYLIKAEGLARTDKISEAMTTLNILRKKRYRVQNYSDLTATNQKDAMLKILKERRIELLFKGARWFDMRRFKDNPDYGVVPRHYFNNGTFIELKPDNPAYTLRIPELALSNTIKQN